MLRFLPSAFAGSLNVGILPAFDYRSKKVDAGSGKVYIVYERPNQLPPSAPAGRRTHDLAMSRQTVCLVLLVAIFLSLTAEWTGVRGQVRKSQAANAAERDEISSEFEITAYELLDRPAPTPQLPGEDPADDKVERNETFFDPQKPPPDNAPIADLIDYWRRALGMANHIRPQPSDAVRDRLLAACEADPQILDEFLPFLPEGEETAGRVIQVYQTVREDESIPASWRARVERWLKFNSTFFLNDLIAEANEVKDKPGGIENEDSLVALAELDPKTAKPILVTLLGADQPRVDALATAWLFRIAVAEHDDENQAKYLRRLRSIAGNRALPDKAHDAAANGLLSAEWEGRDNWYRNQLANRDLGRLAEHDVAFNPLLTPLAQDPDRWIPVLSELLERGDQDEKNNAGNCLVRFVNTHPRRDAVLPLLPWLKDRRSPRVAAAARTEFIFRLGQIDVPEAAPGLGWVAQFEPENRGAAAFALKRHPDPRAVQPLLWALDGASDDGDRTLILDALMACKGITEDDQIRAVKAYALKSMSPEMRAAANVRSEPGKIRLTQLEAVGKYLAQRTEVSDTVADSILEEAEAVRRTDPAMAGALLQVTRNWQVASIDLALFRQLRAGVGGADLIVAALKRRGRLTPAGINAVQLLIGAGGFASGVAAVLTADDAQADHILSGTRSEPKIALLVCARLARTPLPPGAVGELLKSKVELLAFAAEQYLLAEDSRDARAQLWRHFPQRAYVTGWRENARPVRDGELPFMDVIERDFQREVLAAGDAPREVYATFDRNRRPSRILRVFRDRAVMVRNETEARYRERTISVNELAAFRKYVAARNLTLNGPQFGPCAKDCQSIEFLAMNRGGARRTLVRSAPADLAGLFHQFDLLSVNAKTRYRFESTIAGVEVLIDDPTQNVLDVWQAGNDLRVRIERATSPDESAQEEFERIAAALVSGAAVSAEQRTLRYKLSRIERGRRAWYSLRAGKLIPGAQRPAMIMGGDESDLDLDPTDFLPKSNPRIGLATAGTRTVLAVEESPAWGLWEKRGTLPPQLINRDGPFRNPVLSPDGRWAVATRVYAKNVLTMAGTNQLVRINLGTEEVSPVDLPLSNEIDALVYLPTHLRFLVWVTAGNGQETENPAASGFYLVNPVNGKTARVTGDFTPLLALERRMLQPTSNPHEYWAAISDEARPQTQVGRYDTHDFSFHPIMTIPYVAFDSQAMWVDEANGKLLIVIDGQLVRMPLGPPASAASSK